MNINKATDLLSNIENDRQVQNYIAQANSRYILFNVKEPRENFPNFIDALDTRLLSIAYSYLSIGCSFAENDEIVKGITALEKGASILEYVHTPEENRGVHSLYYRLTSSLAHYAANQYSKAFLVLKEVEFQTHVAKLISAFLKKDFTKLISEINNILLNEEYSDNALIEVDNDDEAANRIYSSILARAFSLLLEYIYSGEQDFLDQCKKTLQDLQDLVSIDDEPSLWWVLRILKIIVEGFNAASLWKVIPPHFEANNIKITRYIQSLLFSTPTIIELFISQRQALTKVMAPEGAVIGLPTSSGKTRIAEIAIMQCLNDNPDSTILYLAPFRSLAFEIEDTLTNTFDPLGFQVSHLYGGSQFSKIDKIVADESNIIVATPEKAKAIIRGDREFARKINLIIIDEGHLVGGSERNTINEIFVEELKYHIQVNGGKIVLLSAVLPNTKEMSSWITGVPDNAVESKWRPSSQRFGLLVWNGRNVNIEWKSAERPYPFNVDFIRPFKIGVKNFPSSKRQAVASVAVKLSEIGSVLLFVGRANMVKGQAEDVLIALGHNPELVKWKNPLDWEIFQAACEEADGADSIILKFAKYGIICHSREIPNDVRSAMERLMRNGNPKVIISTSTLAQGVNIGVSTVIIANAYIGATPISNSDFWNIAGRAGRAFIDSEGKILYAIDSTANEWQVKNSRELANKYFESTNLESANSGILDLIAELFRLARLCKIDKDLLLELVANNDTSKFVSTGGDHSADVMRGFDLIDDTLLSLDVLFDADKMKDPSYWIDDHLRNSLAAIQAERHPRIDESDVIKFLKARNEGIIKLVGNSSRWKAHISGGIPLRASLALENRIYELLSALEEYNKSDKDINNLAEFLKKSERIISDFPTYQFKSTYNEEYDKIRTLWLSGADFRQIEMQIRNGRDICADHFGFTIPWALNAISRKLYGMELESEANQFSELAVLTELGLPDLKSSKLYLSGIRSRIAAVELGKIMTFSENISLTKLRSFLIENKIRLSRICAKTTLIWIEALEKTEIRKQQNKIEVHDQGSILTKASHEKIKYSIREFNNTLFLVSPDYQHIIKINKTPELSVLVNNPGIYFIRINKDTFNMISRNPRISIIKKKNSS